MPKVLTCSSPLKFNLISLHTLYKVSCQDLFITITSVYEYLQKAVISLTKQPGCKKCEANHYKQPKTLISSKAKKLNI